MVGSFRLEAWASCLFYFSWLLQRNRRTAVQDILECWALGIGKGEQLSIYFVASFPCDVGDIFSRSALSGKHVLSLLFLGSVREARLTQHISVSVISF